MTYKTAVLLLVLPAVFFCLSAAQDQIPDDLRNLAAEYIQAQGPEAKRQVAKEAMLKYPNMAMVMDQIIKAYVDHTVDELGYVEEAAAFLTREFAPLVTDPAVERMLSIGLVRTYGRPPFRDELEAHVSSMDKLELLPSEDLTVVLNAAIDAGSMSLLEKTADLYDDRATVEAVRQEYAQSTFSEERITTIASRRKGKVHVAEAWILMEEGRLKEAQKHLDTANRLLSHDAFGKPGYRSMELQGRLLMKSGKADEAARYFTWEYSFGGNKKIEPLLKSAWKESGSAGMPFETYLASIVEELAPALPELTAVTLDGKSVELKDYLGKVTILNLWTTTCTKCMVELPRLDPVYQKYKDDGLRIVAVEGNIDPDNARAFWDANDISFPTLVQKSGAESLFLKMNIDATPTSYVINEDGRVVNVHVGYSAGDELKLEREIVALLQD